ncbi:MAG: FkbM family methyltransferase [Gemmatimonadota bacterium]|nr:MAG: FkbM family methyltransferase [Gemmatimonadota bacterium]
MTTFVDLGAYTGDSCRRYLAAYAVEHAYLFEPNLVPLTPPACPHTLLRAAAWTCDGVAPLYVSRLYAGEGSTLLAEKTTGAIDRAAPVEVPTVDFAAWLRPFARQDVVLKMNVEGAEYALIDHLAARRALGIPRVIYLSLHTAKVGKTAEDDERVRDHLRAAGFASTTCDVYDAAFFEKWVRTIRDDNAVPPRP